MLKEFKEFAVKGSAFDMAVGIIIGAAFGGIVSSLVNDIVTLPIALLLGSVDFLNQFFVLKDANGSGVYSTLADAKKAGAVTLNFGVFVNVLINFLIVAFALFFMVRTVNKLRTKEETAVSGVPARECPFCK